MVDIGHQLDTWIQAFPSHRAGISQHRFNRVQQRPVPMSFQDAPASFNRVVFAVIRRIVRRCLKSLMLGNPSYHQVSHGDVNHRLAALREELIILVQSPVFVQPTECPLHAPPFGQNHKPFHVVGGLDNLETNLAIASKLPHPSDEWPRLGAIGPNTAQAGQLMTQKSQ